VRFHARIFETHLEEASFLFDHRCLFLTKGQSPWPVLAGFEERLHAHLDGLVGGGELATATCRARATAGDAGELYAAVSVFCRQSKAPLVAEVLTTVDYDDPARTRAVTDALKHELPDEWREHCQRALANGDRRLAPILAQVLAYRRLLGTDILFRTVRDAAPGAVPALLWSIGRAGGHGAAFVVRPLLHSGDRAIAHAALLAALRLHDDEAFRGLMASAATPEADPIGLGLAAGRRMVRFLVSAHEQAESRLDVVTALGLLGDLSAVRPLIDLLSVDDLAGAAAEALHVITGAPLFEDVLIPEPIREEELFPDELTAFREHGEVPRRQDGQPFGTSARRLTREPAVWNDWIATNSSRFQAGRRYRTGVLYSPRVLLACLESETFPKSYRRWVGEELQVRYGIDLRFEADMFVARQRCALKAAAARIADSAAAFEPGEWYFACRPVS
jgi:hypothetical protein